MFDNAFTSEAFSEAVDILINDMPFALWETTYVTVLATLFAVIIGQRQDAALFAHNEQHAEWAKRAASCRCRSG